MPSPDHKKGLRENPSSLFNRSPEKIKETFSDPDYKGSPPATHIQIWVASATSDDQATLRDDAAAVAPPRVHGEAGAGLLVPCGHRQLCRPTGAASIGPAAEQEEPFGEEPGVVGMWVVSW